AASEILVGARTFLEVERFDRGPRRGQVMLAAADAEHVGQGTRWVPAVEGLVRAGLLGAEHLAEVRWLAVFGRWIGNTDMHLGNLSLTLDGTRISGLAPAYDMLPMAFAPVANEVVPRTFEPTLDGLGGVPALEVHAAAVAFWARVAADPRVSPGFQSIAASCREALVRLEAGVRWLGAGAP
ncbi:MAG: HipA domain-containing protein, partial [Myxococcales bacterium]|nr:HipA domain-containing protein [Myxococcales bacterium]